MGVLQAVSMVAEPKSQQHPDLEVDTRARRCILSPFELTKVDRQLNPSVNDTKVNLAARRSLGAWRIQRWSRGRRREHGVEDGRWKGKKGKKNGFGFAESSDQSGPRC